MRLNDTIVRKTKPDDKPRKLFDGGGLYLLVNPNGSRWWKMKYRFNGVEKMLSFGVYPTISLKLARERREAARRQIAQGLDHAVERNLAKRDRANTFEAVAREWWAKRKKNWSEEYARAVMTRFEQDIFPRIGSRQIRARASTVCRSRRLGISGLTIDGLDTPQ
jgi:hypothetical protein